MRTKLTRSSAIVLALCASISSAEAAPKLRKQVEQKGDFVLTGNTIGYECNGPLVTPVVGTASCMGTTTQTNTDTAPDIYWRSDAPMDGQAAANNMITAAQARSTAQLEIPAGATVTHAYLYWGATLGQAGVDDTVTLDGPGGFTGNITAIESYQSASNSYQSVADITSIVQMSGSGPYRVSGIQTNNFVNVSVNVLFGGWWLVVFYQLDSEPIRNLALFDGMDNVSNGNNQNVNITGFLAPNPVTDAKLGVVTFEGDTNLSGDQLFFSDLMNPLSDGQNPIDNFFNGTRSSLGVATHLTGDLPEMPGTPGSLASMDIDIVDVKSRLMPGQTSADIRATSSQDQYFLAGWVTSIATQRPDFSTSNKTAVDLNGGVLKAGDILEYTIDVTNTGNDTSINTVLTDAIPTGTSYVPGSIEIISGANTGVKTDAVGDDQGEFDSAANSIVVRLGVGADGMQGGTMLVTENTKVKFRVKIEPGASGTISNQAVITADGMLGAKDVQAPTDGNGIGSGAPPTEIEVEACTSNTECGGSLPYCNVDANPNVCVECLNNTHCNGLEPICNLDTNACECNPNGADVCGDFIDNDCNGTIDDECDTDGDGLLDSVEIMIGTDPKDADSDDDGVPDGQELNPGEDADGDMLPNALDPDSDNDGLYDGTEMGKDCSNPDTDTEAGHCIADGDSGTTTTDPLDPDTDDGGVNDGSEDTNKNGVVDPEETDPTTGHGDDDNQNVDSDGDGLSDDFETSIGTNPKDADSDDDGVPDGMEPNPADDADGDGLINALDPDSDNDGLYDGTEMGRDCMGMGTDTTKNHCIPDGDGGSTTTNPLDPDTDNGGVTDGSEDSNHNGVLDEGETDPTTGHGSDDSQNVDTDGDGLTDDFETSIGSNPKDADSDDDGVPDGMEPNPADDTDGDGKINVLDSDSDNDGLFDGTELGLGCSLPDTDPAAKQCIPDGDNGLTKTSPVDPDTDDGGVIDGAEDSNHNGVLDEGETDPTKGHGDDDFSVPRCTTDADCGNETSGQICDAMTQGCVPGCRGANGNGCPSGQTCSSTDATAGVCSVPPGGGTFDGWGNGILCATRGTASDDHTPVGWLAGFAAAVAMTLRRRRRSSR